MTVAMLLANGFETAEALVPLDILKRGGVAVTLCGVTGEYVTSSHGVTVNTDIPADRLDDFDMLLLPGGAAGVNNLYTDEKAQNAVRRAASEDKWLAAICAAPLLPARAGLLHGKNAVCHPSVQDELRELGVLVQSGEHVVLSGNIITARAVGSSFEFGFACLAALCGLPAAQQAREAMLWGKAT
ncbi:MAG: DJ-1/PfpI family protein [Oscillospiraceae bacterium]|jgi:4-methyl-5(b-hydroxyethyl)-thiazole monophosphate biosynthesis|nr:DJ-1/PfpI family protein [Oscillospiraceae bacterium]